MVNCHSRSSTLTLQTGSWPPRSCRSFSTPSTGVRIGGLFLYEPLQSWWVGFFSNKGSDKQFISQTASSCEISQKTSGFFKQQGNLRCSDSAITCDLSVYGWIIQKVEPEHFYLTFTQKSKLVFGPLRLIQSLMVGAKDLAGGVDHWTLSH